MSHFVLMQ